MAPEETSELTKLIQDLHNGNEAERANAAEEIHYLDWDLGPLDPDAKLAVEALIKALGDEEPMVRCEVCLALGSLSSNALGEDETAIAAIPELLRVFTDDQESDVRESAMEGLSMIADSGLGLYTDQAVPLLVRALHDENNVVRDHAAGILGKLAAVEPNQLEVSLGPYTDQAVPLLIRALHDENNVVRCGAAISLGSLVLVDPHQLHKVLAALEKVAESSDEANMVRAVAYEAIEQLSGDDT